MGSLLGRFGVGSGSVWGRFVKIWENLCKVAEIVSGKVLSGKVGPPIGNHARPLHAIHRRATFPDNTFPDHAVSQIAKPTNPFESDPQTDPKTTPKRPQTDPKTTPNSSQLHPTLTQKQQIFCQERCCQEESTSHNPAPGPPFLTISFLSQATPEVSQTRPNRFEIDPKLTPSRPQIDTKSTPNQPNARQER